MATNGWFASYGAPAGEYRLEVSSPGMYPQEILRVMLPVEAFSIRLSAIHPYTSSPFFMEIFSSASTLDGLDIPLGAVVSVRDGDGVVCGASVVEEPGRYGFLHVYADDDGTPEDEGAEIGDVLSVYVNDVPTGATTTYTNHGATTRVDFTANTMAPRDLVAGLNLVSLAVTPYDTALADILSSINGKYSYVAGFDQTWEPSGARTYVDSLAEFSDLHTLDGYHGYWLRMSEPGALLVNGTRLHDDVPINLPTGWSLVAYLGAAPRATESVLGSIMDRLAVAGGFRAGAMTYVPGSPFNDLDEFEYGLGYWINVNAPAVLNYRLTDVQQPLARAAGAVIAEGAPVPTPRWMDIYGSATLDGVALAAGTAISIVDETGVICGVTNVRDGGSYGFLHVYGDDARTELDEGATIGSSLGVLLDGERAFVEPIVWQGAQTVVRYDLAMTSSPTAVSSDRPLRFALDGATPNPFNPTTSVRFELAADEHVKLVVFDQLGRHVRTLVDGHRAPDRYSATWDGTDATGREVASGVYVVRLTTPSGVLASRVTLLR